ncbi:hypothetical protein [Actinomadura oligospora]|uniref:hypothetical protein n=1 Tax=Actinomadura oligospora TaxID=111804 RepID=UPI0006869C2C|nr:hypothetical protein [Actinomadura oligospora]
MAAVTQEPLTGPVQRAWHVAHEPVRGVGRWTRIAAYAVPLTVLPSSLWRIVVFTFHAPILLGDRDAGSLPSWLPLELYVVLLSVISELFAFTAIGLAASWGEVFPRWIPLLRGRTVPRAVGVVPAALGTLILTVLWTALTVSFLSHRTITGRPLPSEFPVDYHHWQGILALAAYAPLILWGPLLGILTIAYWRRRAHTGEQTQLPRTP